jgi:hypothetical protein
MIRGIVAAAGIVFLALEWANTGLFAQFSSGVQLIEVYATVTDAKGRSSKTIAHRRYRHLPPASFR